MTEVDGLKQMSGGCTEGPRAASEEILGVWPNTERRRSYYRAVKRGVPEAVRVSKLPALDRCFFLLYNTGRVRRYLREAIRTPFSETAMGKALKGCEPWVGGELVVPFKGKSE